jgi:hypothetical protein
MIGGPPCWRRVTPHHPCKAASEPIDVDGTDAQNFPALFDLGTTSPIHPVRPQAREPLSSFFDVPLIDAMRPFWQ